MASIRARILATGKVREVYADEDGKWAVYADGWRMCDAEIHEEHADTWAELLRDVRNGVRCSAGCSCGFRGEG